MSEDERIKDLERELDVWGDKYMNKHFLYRAVELVIVRVLPEMGEAGCRELMESRGIV